MGELMRRSSGGATKRGGVGSPIAMRSPAAPLCISQRSTLTRNTVRFAATMLVNSRVAAPAATSVYRHGAAVDLRSLPDKALEETTDAERKRVADVIGTMTSWPWVGASLATKSVHKKRPRLIPILDNQAIFGAFMNPLWPEKRSSMDTIKAVPRINEALDWIAADLTRPENTAVWPELEAIEPERSRIELFDMIWWMYFRRVEPVAPTTTA